MKQQLVLCALLLVYLITFSSIHLYKLQVLAVVSNSMSPHITTGDLIIVQPQLEYAIGDIISFKKNNSFATHKIVGLAPPASFVTKGEQNTSFDKNRVHSDAVLGKVIHVVPKLGYAVLFIQSAVSRNFNI